MTTFPMPPNYWEHVLVASPWSAVRQRVLESLTPRARRVEQSTGFADALFHLQGKFREDLYCPLSAFPQTIPSLRDQREDVLSPPEQFLQTFSAGLPAPLLSDEALAKGVRHAEQSH